MWSTYFKKVKYTLLEKKCKMKNRFHSSLLSLMDSSLLIKGLFLKNVHFLNEQYLYLKLDS